ncbi:MAG: PrsW family glutamic-type intramembrane protease [Patescibacteria group bacterium]
MFEFIYQIEFSLTKTAVVLLAVGLLAMWDLTQRVKHRNAHYLFACILGTLLSVGFITFSKTLLAPGAQSGFALAFGIVLLLFAWKLLFGPWEAETKAAVLGAFVFWVALHILWQETSHERLVHAIAIAVALIPAIVWCLLFRTYQRERLSLVLLLFFAGMLSTAPILFYDALVRRGAELNFFFFKVTPLNFGRMTEQFVSLHAGTLPDLHQTLLTVFLSFVLVGLIEECSKYWVLKKSGQGAFTSVDDVIQLAVITAIGFSFAENIANQTYFPSFVSEYLMAPERDVYGFFGNVVGRSILTTMVHIVSTGLLGYFLGRALFADPELREMKERGREPIFAGALSKLLRIKIVSVYKAEMIAGGFLFAIFLHALSNFLVTLPDVLPGNPRTFGDLLDSPEKSFLHAFSILLVPALLYVVGGFWLLTSLLLRKANIKMRGRIISTDIFVTQEEVL